MLHMELQGFGRVKTLPYKKKTGAVRGMKTVVRKEKILCFARKKVKKFVK